MSIPSHVQELKNVLDMIKGHLDPQEFNALSKLVEGQRQLVVVVKEPEGLQDIWEPLLDLYANQVQNLLHFEHVKHCLLLFLSCHAFQKLVLWLLQFPV